MAAEAAADYLKAAQALDWQDGKATAGATAVKVKDNLQADFRTPETQKLLQNLAALLYGNAGFMVYSRPRAIHGMLLNCYQNGGHYGAHVDNVFTRASEQAARRDLSFTLGLTPRDSYEGGELVMLDGGQRYSYKADAGEVIVYAAGMIHEVKPVTSGSRVCMVGWIESWVMGMEQRLALMDFERVLETLQRGKKLSEDEMLHLQACKNNFLRLLSG